MPAVRLNQRSGGATVAGSAFQLGELFSDLLSPLLSVFGCLQFNLLAPQRLLSGTRAILFGARFKLLSAGAGSKHGDLCNEQIRDSNERSNLSLRVLFAQAPFQTRAVAAKKFICKLAGGCNFSGSSPTFF
jgi:hypothetical protein